MKEGKTMDTFVVIDIEATGNINDNNSRIIDIALVVIQDDEIIDQYATLINPEIMIPHFITSLTGIKNEDVKDEPLFSEVVNKIKTIINDKYIIGHNVLFDVQFLNKELLALEMNPLENKIIDTVELSRVLFPTLLQYKLSSLSQQFGFGHDTPHRALSDAIVTSHLFLKLKKKLISLPHETKYHLSLMTHLFHSDLDELIAQSKLTETNTKNQIIFNDLSFNNIFHDEDEVEKTEVIPYGQMVDHIYGEEGELLKQFPTFDNRLEQINISEQIYGVFQAKRHALIEAATGIGKTIAYLIPAIYEAYKTNEPIIISTEKLNLQTQLLEEDLPKLKQLLPFTFRYTALKGKRHYLNLEKFHEQLNEQTENYNINLVKAMIIVWITETNTGDFNELNLPSGIDQFIESISAETEKMVSAWQNYSYYKGVFKRAEKSQVIIVNHALLCTDLHLKNDLIPNYNKVIIDEAHQFANIAEDQVGLLIDFKYVLRKIDQLKNIEQTSYRALKQSLFDLSSFILHNTKKAKRLELNNEQDESTWQSVTDMINRIIYSISQCLKYVKQTNLVEALQKIKLNFILISEISFNENYAVSFERIKLGDKANVYIHVQQLNIASFLISNLFQVKQSVILIGATLTIENSFNHIIETVGLTDFTPIKSQFSGPFNLHKQMKILVPNDFPSVNEDFFLYTASEAIISLIHILKGNTLILFTSHEMLQSVYYLLDELIGLQYNLIAQNITHRNNSDMLNEFKTVNNSVLLGTNAFWEGIDVPGHSLKGLIIVKLPFDNPQQAKHKLKQNKLTEQGSNSFYHYMLPRMIIKLRQGIGRLIRTKTDQGVILVLDNRIYSASYSEKIMSSIKEYPIIIDSTSSLMSNTERFFDQKKTDT